MIYISNGYFYSHTSQKHIKAPTSPIYDPSVITFIFRPFSDQTWSFPLRPRHARLGETGARLEESLSYGRSFRVRITRSRSKLERDLRYHWVMVVPFASAYQGVCVCLRFTAHKYDLPLRICVRSPCEFLRFFSKKNVCLSISDALLNLTSNKGW